MKIARYYIVGWFLLHSAYVRAEQHGFTGQWEYAGYAPEEDALSAAIEHSVSQMNFLFRSIARSRLKRTNQPAKLVVLTVKGVESTLERDGFALSCYLDARECQAKSHEGENITVRHRLDGHMFRETIQAKHGQREIVLEIQEGVLVMTVTISSPQMPVPVAYSLTYKRASQAANGGNVTAH